MIQTLPSQFKKYQIQAMLYAGGVDKNSAKK
jgi:hypothetical protein